MFKIDEVDVSFLNWASFWIFLFFSYFIDTILKKEEYVLFYDHFFRDSLTPIPVRID